MAEPIGALRVDLSANASQFEKDMNRARSAVSKSTTQMGRSFDNFRGNIRSATQGLFSLQAAIAGLGVGIALRGIINTSAEFQRLRTSLKTVTGSAEAATQAFNQIKEFAATTPFSLQEVTQGFIKLKALGLDPSAEALESYGNTASAMGKSLNDFVEAVADAITGEFERLKEFGIRASSEGDRVKLTFQGLTTEIGKNATEIEAYLRNIGLVQFAGAMDEQAKTLGGALSNLGDAASVFANEVGEGGLADAVEDVARRMSDLTNGAHNLARELGSGLGDAVQLTAKAMEVAGDNIRYITAGIAAFVAFRAAVMFGTVAASVAIFAAQLHTASLAMTSLNVAMRANPIGALATVISAAVAAMILFYDKTFEVGDTTVKVGDVMDAVWTTVTKTIFGLIESTAMLALSMSRFLTLDFEGAADAWMASSRAITEGVGDIVDSWRKVGAEAEPVKAALEDAAEATVAVTTTTTEAIDKLAELRAQLQFEIDQLGRSKTEQELYNLAKKAGTDVNDEFRSSILPLIEQLASEEEKLKAVADAVEADKKAKERGLQITKELRTEQEKYNDRVSELSAAHEAGTISAETYNRGLENAKKTLDEANKAAKEGSNLAEDLGLTFTSAFEDAALSGGKLSDVLRGIEQDLLRMAFREIITQPLLGAVKGFDFGSILPGFASGGAHMGGLRIVGERGPEIEATGPARYYSAGRSADLLRGDGGSGGGDVQVNVYAPPGTTAETRESTGPGGRSIDVIIDETNARLIGTPGSRTGRALRNNFSGVQPQLKGRG